MMKAIEIRNKYLKFFEKNGHKVIPSSPLIPENDPSVLFTTAGMQPLVPYLLVLNSVRFFCSPKLPPFSVERKWRLW